MQIILIRNTLTKQVHIYGPFGSAWHAEQAFTEARIKTGWSSNIPTDEYVLNVEFLETEPELPSGWAGKQILNLLSDHPEIDELEISEKIGWSLRQTCEVVDRLKSEGLIGYSLKGQINVTALISAAQDIQSNIYDEHECDKFDVYATKIRALIKALGR